MYKYMDANSLFSACLKEAKKPISKKERKNKEYVQLKRIHKKLINVLQKISDDLKKERSAFEESILEIYAQDRKKIARKLISIKHILDKIFLDYSFRIKNSKNIDEKIKLKKSFYGRTFSLLKSIDFNFINSFYKTLKEIPKIDWNERRIILCGAPNVGKSTLLNTMTGSNVKIASYPFTTQKIQIGILERNNIKIQMIDIPGLLNREPKNKYEKIATQALKHISKEFLFLLDPSETCGFSLKEQEGLLDRIIKEFNPNIIIKVSTKKDLGKVWDKAEFAVNCFDSDDVEKIVKVLIEKG
ncbi:MAG: GTPase [archaeon]